MAKKFKIKKGDQVMVIAGDDKGTVGEVLQVLPKKDAVIVAGCKTAKKAVKPCIRIDRFSDAFICSQDTISPNPSFVISTAVFRWACGPTTPTCEMSFTCSGNKVFSLVAMSNASVSAMKSP